MEAPPSPGSSSSAITPVKKTKKAAGARPYYCATCKRSFSNRQGYSRHRNVHAREEMAAMIRNQANTQSSIQHHVHQPDQFEYGPSYHTQNMNDLVPMVGSTMNRNLVGVGDPKPNGGDLMPLPNSNPVMNGSVLLHYEYGYGEPNPMQGNRMPPFIGESSSGGSRRTKVMDASGKEVNDEELDLSLHL